jgi:glucose-6-phosphate 1-dehydrogenase
MLTKGDHLMPDKTLEPERLYQPIVRIRADDMAIPHDDCRIPRRSDPCAIIIAGATGDLTARKLMPALFNLYLNDGLSENFSIIGCGRTQLDDQQFRKKMEDAVAGDVEDPSPWHHFAKALHYFPLDYDDPNSYLQLADFLKELDVYHHTDGNRVFYLALPPSLYAIVAEKLGKAGLGREYANRNGWARLVVEKPFGRDLESAVKLDRGINQYFKEHQVFRIDHYLAKETVQNILMFRFANTIFEPVWNRRYIKSVEITAIETLGVEHRAGYYEQAGVLRDMFQNHMMQLLAFTAMEPPSRFEAERVRDERVKLFRSVRPFPVQDLRDYLVLGQYGRGENHNGPLAAFREEPGVDSDSLTPTYARMKVFVDNWRWQGVPFVLTSGKRLSEKLTRIAIQFREIPHSMFRQVLGQTISPNRLTLGIYPEERISLTFQTKTPGPRVCLRNVTMDFFYHQKDSGPMIDAYAKVLLDCMLGDQMLFWRQDAVELCWSFLTPILTECEACTDRPQMLHSYPAGGQGPEAALHLL